MANKSVTALNSLHAENERSRIGIERPAGSGAGESSGRETSPQKMTAFYLSPGCEHEWVKLANHCQTLKAEGKTIWRCRECDEITHTYDWQAPRE